ncbi:hypothetical protein B5P43_17300 [Bacillus sp. SRB_336]|nr:hypothetical protein B5P43_17300 [Bacillus sp. SRB_336]
MSTPSTSRDGNFAASPAGARPVVRSAAARGAPRTALPGPLPGGHRTHRPPIRFLGRRSTAAALVAGAALNAASAFVNTAFLRGAPTADGYAAALSDRVPLGMAGLALNIVGIPLMLLGILGLLQAASGRAPVASRIAGWATGIGMVAFLCMNGALAALYGLGDTGEAGRALAAGQLTGTSAGLLALLLPFLLGNAVGMVLTAIALFKSRITPPWVPIMLLAFLVADFILPGTRWLDAHLLFVAFAAGAAWALLRNRQAADKVHWPRR